MSFEKDLKDAFARHADDARPRGDSWDRVERGVRRAHARRLTMVAGSAVALVAALAVVIPTLVTTDGPRFVNPGGDPTPTASESPQPGDTTSWNARAGVQAGFRLRLPPGWRGGYFEGQWDYHPTDLPGLPEGGDTFAIQVGLADGKYDDPQQAPGDPYRGEPEAVEMHFVRGLRWDNSDAASPGVWYRFDWRTVECELCAHQPTLRVIVMASTAELWDRYREIGEQIVQTIEPYDGSDAVHGAVEDGIEETPESRVLVRFMDARIEGIGADEQMCCNAQEEYMRTETTYRSGPHAYTGYNVLGAGPPEAATMTFTVTIDLRSENGDVTDRTERITVGYESGRRGEGPLRILDVEVTGDGA